MFVQKRAPRHPDHSPVSFRLDGHDYEGQLVNLSSTGALVRCADHPALGPAQVGSALTFTSWYDVGALLRPHSTVVRYFEEPQGKHLAVKYLPD